MGADASILDQQLDGGLTLVEYMQTAARVPLDVILSAYKALQVLGLFSFVASHLFSMGRRHLSAIAEILHFIERL